MNYKNKETWKPVKEYEGFYDISNFGRVKRVERDKDAGRWGHVHVKEKIMKQGWNGGYCYVNLTKKGEQKGKRVHRMMAEAFIPNLENKPCINHKDGDKANNDLSNLEWCTYAENNQHACDFGLRPRKIGEEVHNAKLNNLQVRVIRHLKNINPSRSNQKIAEMFGVNYMTIGRVISKKTYINA